MQKLSGPHTINGICNMVLLQAFSFLLSHSLQRAGASLHQLLRGIVLNLIQYQKVMTNYLNPSIKISRLDLTIWQEQSIFVATQFFLLYKKTGDRTLNAYLVFLKGIIESCLNIRSGEFLTLRGYIYLFFDKKDCNGNISSNENGALRSYILYYYYFYSYTRNRFY